MLQAKNVPSRRGNRYEVEIVRLAASRADSKPHPSHHGDSKYLSGIKPTDVRREGLHDLTVGLSHRMQQLQAGRVRMVADERRVG